MAKSFLEAIEEKMPLYGVSPITGRPRTSSGAPKKKKEPLTEEETAALDEAESYGYSEKPPVLVDMQDRMRGEGMAQAAGGGVDDESTSSPMGSSSTEMPKSDADPYRITSGEEDVPEVSYADLVGVDPSALGSKAPAIEVEPREALDSALTRIGEGDDAYRITSSEEPVPAEEMDPGQPKFNKSDLLDPLMGARQAGIPIEHLEALFKKTHGGRFNANSKTDRLKMSTIKDMIQEDKSMLSLSPMKFAMKVYARK